MATDQTDVRLLLSQELKDIRSKIEAGELVLFVGEQVSILVTSDKPRPSLDDWWQVVNQSEVRRAPHLGILKLPFEKVELLASLKKEFHPFASRRAKSSTMSYMFMNVH